MALARRLEASAYFELPCGVAFEALDAVCCAGWAAVTGVTMTPVTSPLIAARLREPMTPRALRVASRLALAAAFCSGVGAFPTFFGWRPKSARTSGEVPN